MAYVHPQYQRKGFGTEALTNIIRRARNAGVTKVYAKARKDTGGATLAAKAGMQVIKEENGEVFFRNAAQRARDKVMTRLQLWTLHTPIAERSSSHSATATPFRPKVLSNSCWAASRSALVSTAISVPRVEALPLKATASPGTILTKLALTGIVASHVTYGGRRSSRRDNTYATRLSVR
jgi:hypothetical protein